VDEVVFLAVFHGTSLDAFHDVNRGALRDDDGVCDGVHGDDDGVHDFLLDVVSILLD
jgi:hypothetical protein